MRTSRSSNRPRPLALILLGLLSLLFVATGRPAAAQQGEPAFQRHWERSRALYQEGRYDECIQELKDAYRLRQLPRLILNMGQAYRKLGQAREALSHYRLYLQVEPAPAPEIRDEVLGYIKATEAMLQAVEGQPSAPPPRAAPPAAPPPRAPLLRAPPASAKAGPPPPQPLYRKWWFWTALGGVAAVGVTAGVIGWAVSSSREQDGGLPPVEIR